MLKHLRCVEKYTVKVYTSGKEKDIKVVITDKMFRLFSDKIVLTGEIARQFLDGFDLDLSKYKK